MKEPKIRLKGFCGEWEETIYGESVTINSGMDYKHLAVGEIPVYGTGGYMLSVNESLSDIDAIGIGRKGTIDKPQLLKAPFWTVDTLFFMTPKKGNNLNFLFALSQKTNWRKYDESTGVPSLSKINIAKIAIALPNKKEQIAIASYFQHLDTFIQSTTKKIESLKQVKAASLQSMFPQEGETKPRVRFKGFEGEWEKLKADVIFKTFNEKNLPHLPVLSATQDRGMVMREEIGYNIFHDKSNEKTYKHILPGQFVIHLRSFQGGFAHSSIEGIASPAYTVMEFKNKSEHSDLFWKCIFMSKEFIKRLELITYGIRDGRSISFEEFSEMYFLVPSYEEQTAIASFFTNLDTQITLQTQRLEKLKQIKSACLDNMFV